MFNRFLLLEYENLLREIDCRITIPYWDWTALPTTPYVSPVWSNRNGFGDSSRPSDRCVATGPFRVGVFSQTPSGGGGCVKREYNEQTYPTRAIIERDLLTQPGSEFFEFQRFFQIFIHTNVRCFVGGTMCTQDALNDPAYLVHLSMVDYIFDRWQRLSSDRLTARYANDLTLLALAGKLTVNDFHDNDNLPNNVRVNYATPIVTRVVEPDTVGKVHLATTAGGQASENVDNNRPTTMGCLSDDQVKELVDEKDQDFFKEQCKRM